MLHFFELLFLGLIKVCHCMIGNKDFVCNALLSISGGDKFVTSFNAVEVAVKAAIRNCRYVNRI